MKRLAGLEDVGVKRVADGGFASWLTILAHYCSLARIDSGGGGAELRRIKFADSAELRNHFNNARLSGNRRNVEIVLVCRSVDPGC